MAFKVNELARAAGYCYWAKNQPMRNHAYVVSDLQFPRLLATYIVKPVDQTLVQV